jgi:hypothetical protein
MSREPPCWNPDAVPATVLMDYVKRVSPEFVAAELDQLGLLDAADEAAARIHAGLATVPRRMRANLWMVALAMCAMIVVLAETLHLGAMTVVPEDNSSQFMQLAGPTPEW